MEKTKFRCHFSIIFENTAALWIFLAVVLFGQIQDVIEFATSLEKEDMWAVLGGFLALIGLTLIVFLYQFLVCCGLIPRYCKCNFTVCSTEGFCANALELS